MLEQTYDVVIIGCGVSGIASALRCLEAGIKCIVITDNCELINSDFQVTPSESVHPGIKSVLEMLTEVDLLELASRGKYSGIKTSQGFNSLGFSDGETWFGYHLDKPLFLKGLLASALSLGLDIKDKEQVQRIEKCSDKTYIVESKSGRHYRGRYLIDASGRRQILGKLLGLNKTYYSPYLTCSSGLVSGIPFEKYTNLTTSFTMEHMKWTWIAPEINNCCTWTKVSLKEDFNVSRPSVLTNYNAIGPTIVRDMRWRLYESTTHEGIILTGEAAGLLDPASGQGILLALMSGIMAADCVKDYFYSNILMEIVSKNYNDWFSEFYLSKMIKLREYYFSC